MSYDQVLNITRELRSGLGPLHDEGALCNFLTAFLAKHFKASRVTVHWPESDNLKYSWPHPSPADKLKTFVSSRDGSFVAAQEEVELPLFISDVNKSRAPQSLLSALKMEQCSSFAAAAVYKGETPKLIVEISHSGSYFKWRKDFMFLLEQICSLVEIALSSQGEGIFENVPAAPQIRSAKNSYERLARYGNLLFIKINSAFQIIEILGDTQKILGLDSKELLADMTVWQRYISAPDLKRIRRNFARMRFMHQEFSEEVLIKTPHNGEGVILFVRAMPIYDDEEKLLFWEGFALDITEKRKRESQILNQRRRIEALYEVAQSTQAYHDPALVMLRGLKAVIKATNSDAGLGCFYDLETKKIEVAALEGVSQQFMQDLEKRISSSTLINRAIQTGECAVFKNIQEEPMALVDMVRREGLKATLVVPLLLDGHVRGVLVLYCREADRYEQRDIDLVSAAGTQISIASRQAEYFIAEKQQAAAMSALYEISHELSKYSTPKEIAQRSFPLVQKQFACKRMWFGLLSEQGNHIVGLAGQGPGVRRRLIDIQIELYLRHDFLDQALTRQQPVIVRPGEPMECSGVTKLIARLNLGVFVIIPLIALNQTVGVLVLEPAIPSENFIAKNLSWLMRIGSEIATTLLARRFEAKIAEADKMRMAGLLASGVAHNFNNLLQAVMGQASLLEMQLPKDSALSRSARMIVEAAGKGAGLVNQLLNFSSADSQVKREIVVKSLLEESLELYRSIAGSQIEVKLEVADGLPKIEVDFAQLQQVLSNLIINAKEALSEQSKPQINIRARYSKLISGEVDPELAPGEYVRIDVQDNGIGMDEEKLRRCFEPFFSSKQIDHRQEIGLSGGSGLGLSYAYSIMKQHNGLVTARSHPGQGTVFSLYFPVPKPAMLTGAGDHPDQQLRNKVLLYGLENTVQQSIRPIFGSLGLDTTTLHQNGKTDEHLAEARPQLIALLVDVDKDSFLTIPFLQKASKELEGVFIVVLTSDVRRWSNILSALSNFYIVAKPLNVWGIHALARKILAHRKQHGLQEQLSVERTTAANKEDEKLNMELSEDVEQIEKPKVG